MSDKDTPNEERKVKTLAIRLDPELHARLSVIVQLSSSTITDEIRTAIATHVEAKANDADLAGAAAELLDEIECDTAARSDALTGLRNKAQATTSRQACPHPRTSMQQRRRRRRHASSPAQAGRHWAIPGWPGRGHLQWRCHVLGWRAGSGGLLGGLRGRDGA